MHWPHPADSVKITETKEYKKQTIQAYTDGSKNVHVVGSGVAIFVVEELVTQLKYKLDNGCSNTQTEHLAITKALQVRESLDISVNSARTVTIFTNSRIALNSLKCQLPRLPFRRD
jgi:ribonuclease HI